MPRTPIPQAPSRAIHVPKRKVGVQRVRINCSSKVNITRWLYWESNPLLLQLESNALPSKLGGLKLVKIFLKLLYELLLFKVPLLFQSHTHFNYMYAVRAADIVSLPTKSVTDCLKLKGDSSKTLNKMNT